MFEEIFEDVYRRIERIRRRVLDELERLEKNLARPGWRLDGTLEPLYNVYEYPDRYVIVFDLAGSKANTIEVKVVDDKLVIESKLEKSISYSDIHGTMVGREITFHSYRHVVPLPSDADPEGMRVNIRPNKLVEVIIPKRRVPQMRT